MRYLWIALIFTMTAWGAEKHGPDVVVYLHRDARGATTVGLAEGQAQKMLANVGITVGWRVGKPSKYETAEIIEAAFVEQRDPAFRPGSLAFSALGAEGGVRIQIFYNRISAAAPATLRPIVLGHVLAHEITHVLEGACRHSDGGLMKAQWTAADYERMSRSPLPFSGEDVSLLKAWKDRHSLILLAARGSRRLP